MQRLSCRSNDYSDELVWAASWLYRATNDSRYRTDAERFFNEYNLLSATGFSWDAKISGADVSVAAIEYYTLHEECMPNRELILE